MIPCIAAVKLRVFLKAVSFLPPFFFFFSSCSNFAIRIFLAIIVKFKMGPRNRGGRPTLSQGLDREVSYAIGRGGGVKKTGCFR